MARYNAPLYGVILVAILGGIGLAAGPFPGGLRGVGAAMASVAGWYAIASFGAFYWLFDRSPLLDGHWVAEVVPPPRRWVQLSVFLEQTTLPLATVFPDAEGVELDLFHPDVMTEPAVNRARAPRSAPRPRPASPDALTVPDGWSDATVVTLVAHELRDPDVRRSLFAELARITQADGHIVLVEHTRNLAALMAYGPGWWHFLPAQEWHDRAADAGLIVVESIFVTPFVEVFVLARQGATVSGPPTADPPRAAPGPPAPPRR
jgi:hypothetical protein